MNSSKRASTSKGFRQRWGGWICAVLLLHLILFGAYWFWSKPALPVEHQVTVAHPGYVEDGALEFTLFQQWDESSQSYEFYMDAESVFCADSVCNVVTVRIYWDDLGNYQRYELASGVELEKAEGLPFTDEDHRQLDEILRDKDSLLKDVSLKDIKYHEYTEGDVDAVSSATPVIYDGAAVKGAAWTSFTLWHWVNSDMQSHIKKLTAEATTSASLIAWMNGGDRNHQEFSLHQMIENSAYDTASVDAVINRAGEFDREMVKLTIEYLQGASVAGYQESMGRFLGAVDTEHRAQVLESIIQTKLPIETQWLDTLSDRLQKAIVYQEVDLMLRLMERRNPASAVVVEQVLGLLLHENFLIARRAFWFLGDQTVSPKQKVELDDFEAKYQDRL